MGKSTLILWPILEAKQWHFWKTIQTTWQTEKSGKLQLFRALSFCVHQGWGVVFINLFTLDAFHLTSFHWSGQQNIFAIMWNLFGFQAITRWHQTWHNHAENGKSWEWNISWIEWKGMNGNPNDSLGYCLDECQSHALNQVDSSTLYYMKSDPHQVF